MSDVKKVETGMEVVPSKADLQKKLKAAIRSIDKRLKTVGVDVVDDPWQAGSVNFKYNENDSNSINIYSCSDLPYLIKSLSMILRVKEDYHKTANMLGLKSYPICLWMTLDIDKWIHDLTNRVTQLSNHVMVNSLTKSREELTQFLSQEEKLFSALQRIKDLSL